MTKPKHERRSPDRPSVMLRLLRRVAVYSLVLAAGLFIVPRALVHFALLGPATEQRVAAARQIPPCLRDLFKVLPKETLPMDVLRTGVSALGCTLPEKARRSGKATDWSDVPDDQGYPPMRDAIVRHVRQLLDDLQR